MPRYSTAQHHLKKAVEWVPQAQAERVNDHILFSRGTSNAHVVTTPDGDVVINTGTPYQGVRTRERFETLLGRPLQVRKIIITQSHPDHMGGWSAFADPGVEVLVQEEFAQLRVERTSLNAFFGPRAQRVIQGLMPDPEHVKAWYEGTRELETPTMFARDHAFEVGGRRFELHSTPSGETLDSIVVWLPQDRAVFTGNLMGALYGALPHFYTPRGDRDRSVARSMRDIQYVIDLEPEILITGHDAPIVGAARIKADLSKLRSAIAYIHDETIKGMNAQKDLHTLMREIALPPELQTAPGRGPVAWYVRAVWEEYTGWFRHESTTELYGVPPRAIWAELAELAGGADVLAARAQAHVTAGRPLEALHFIDIVKAMEPAHRLARETEIAALELLIDRGEGRAYDELGWLESQIAAARAAAPT